MQLDQGQKGFSFSQEGPLDMRMDPTSELTAKEIVNHWSEKDLGELFQKYGEEPRWRRAAKAVVEARRTKDISTTKELAKILLEALKTPLKGKWHPATLIFQALRICVNGELDAISEGIFKALKFLKTGGLIGAISFHSLEDRIVKNIFKEASAPPNRRDKSALQPILRLLIKKPLAPSLKEIRMNPRARSAKLRFAQKL